MSIYQKFAGVYDQMGEDNFSVRMFDYSKRILAKLRYRPKTMLDLACGTGTAAVLWAQDNIKTFAIDGSADMLEMARQKAKECGVTIDFSQQKMTEFSLPNRVDLVTSFFDSLNYLQTPKDLGQCFERVREALYPGAYFIFDVNTPEAMRVLWGGEIYADETEDLAWIWKNNYYPKAKLAEVHATFFVKRKGAWERFDEVHAERGYTATEVKSALQKSGFKVVHLYDCLKFKKPGRDSMRIAAVATPR
ncbi:MAG: class I SAM-dependent methyltransferase [Candidatus Zixiibacteriota bacterium]